MTKYLVLSSLALAFLGAACGDATDPIVNRITCGDVCERYRDCFDEDYDVETCTDQCENDATADEEKEEQLEACSECIDDESCSGAVFECTTECASFVP